jgi:hypothetical protein
MLTADDFWLIVAVGSRLRRWDRDGFYLAVRSEL